MKNLIQQIKLLETINQKNVKDKKFLLEKEKNIEIYYAPFDYINSKAKIVTACDKFNDLNLLLVGILTK